MGTRFVQKASSLIRRVNTSSVADHYGKGGSLLNTIIKELRKVNSLDNITIDDLAPMDEFHIGGREATQEFLKQLNICETHHVLDVGCGLGGTARFVASHFGCKVTGVDITPEFISCGKELTRMVGLTNNVELLVGSALDLKTILGGTNHSFDKAFMLHVGMNIEDKSLLVSEIAATLRPGGLLGIYDVMKTGGNATQDLDFPVPWTNDASTNFVAPPDEYRTAIKSAGLKIISERNRHDFAVKFFSNMKEKKNISPIGLHLLMDDFPQKMGNMLGNLNMGRIAPIEMIAEKVY